MATISEHLAAKGLEEPVIAAIPEEVQPQTGGMGIDMGFLMKPTGAGSIESYLDHPLNFKHSRGLAQMIRGATGMFGEGLNSAIVDIGFGGMAFMQERKAANAD